MIHRKGCSGRSFKAVNEDWWVCSSCGMPYPLYLENRMTEPEIRTFLFRGGPHDNEVWTIAQMLEGHRGEAQGSWVVDYRYTSEIAVGTETGTKARVWEYRND